ncbi:phage tail tip lysozyme [Phascolarctobacterium succinatutens]|uniref:phage tail tip lysozyme n=1 Tax=Phascolarctobacterium succinatutens TaxID=626940 RepID=UPI0026EFE858|nr:phage tail tip lysozyme [Phascolarctobacterium succinatutens]
MSNILEEYLVRIGAEVDKDAFAGAAQAISKLSDMLGKLGTILKYGGIFVGLAKVTEAVIDNIKAVASADLEYQKLAQSMWVTKDTAKTLSVVLKTMGASQEDVAWVPELREQFFRLRQEMAELSTPADADGQLAWIREIGYDVQSLQLKLKMFKEWVVYYLIKELQPYIKEFQEFIRWLNDKFGKSLPALARKVASVLASVVRVAMSLVKALKWLFEGIYNFIDALPSKTKALVAVFAVVGAAIMSGPFGLMMMAIGTALIMLEDFFGYLEGRESSETLKPLWKWLTDENNPLRRLIEKLKEGIAFILEKLTELFEKVFTEERQEKLKKTVANIAKGVAEIAEGLATIVESIFGKKYPVVKKFWDFFLTAVGKVVDKVLTLTNSMGHLMRALGKAMQGDFKGAREEFINAAADENATGERSKYIQQKLMSMGFSASAAAGVVGNLVQESGLRTDAIGDNGTSGGLAQWHNERLDALKRFAAARGKKWTDLDTQIEFLAEEMRTSYADTYAKMQSAELPEIAGQIMTDEYEKPDSASANYAQRQANARAAYEAMRSGNKQADDYHGDGGGGYDSLVAPTSYAAGFAAGGTAGLMPMANSTANYNGGVVNVGGIVVNCGNVSDPQGVAKAVEGTMEDFAQRLAAHNGGTVFV